MSDTLIIMCLLCACVHACVCARVYACVRVCVCMCGRMCMRVCKCMCTFGRV